MHSSEEYLDNLLKALLENDNSAGAEPLKNEPDPPEEPHASTEETEESKPALKDNDVLEGRQTNPAATVSNKAMSTDEIEEMLASMNAVSEEKPLAEETVSENGATLVEQIVNELMPGEPVEETEQDGQIINELPEEAGLEVQEDSWHEEQELREDLFETDRALEEDVLAEESESQEEDSLPEEENPLGNSGGSDWALEEIGLPEEEELQESPNVSDLALEEELFPEEEPQENPDTIGLALEEMGLPEEEELRESPKVSDLVLEEELFPEEEPQENPDTIGLALEENFLPEEEEQESPDVPDLALEEDALPEEEDTLPEEEEPQENLIAIDWTLEEDPMAEEQKDLLIADWALEEDPLEEDPLMADWALEEDSMPEEPKRQEDPFIADWALEEESLPEEIEPENEVIPEPSTEAMIPDERPEMDEKPEAGESSETGENPSAGEVPETGENPSAGEVPETGENPSADETPETGENLEAGESPEVSENPETVENPGMDENPETVENPGMDENPETGEEPGAGENPETDERLSPDGWSPIEGLNEEPFPEAASVLNDRILEDDFSLEELLSESESIASEVVQEEETALNDLLVEAERMPDDTALGKSVQGDSAMADRESDNLEMENGDMAKGSTMSEEDIDRLLGDDFALEETGEDDEGLSTLLAGMDQDEDLSEINDLLEKADKGLTEDDEMLALLGDSSAGDSQEGDDAFDFWDKEESNAAKDGSAEKDYLDELESIPTKKKEKKKKEKTGRKKKGSKDGMEAADKLLAKLGDEKERPKKQGAFGKFLSLLLEDEEDFPSEGNDDRELGMELGSISDENKEVLAELNAEDKKNAGKKADKKKDKKKKANDKKAKQAKKAKKPKKAKPKKEKKVKAGEPAVPEKGISRTKIVFVVLFCASVAACIIVVNMFIPDYMQRQEACKMYDENRYEEAYELLYGKTLNEEEEAVLQKSTVILQVRQTLDFYENYSRLNMSPEALNALLEGVERYYMFRADAEQYGVTAEIDSIYAQILAELSGNYGVSEEDALNILASEDDLTYSEKLYGVINGTGIEGTDEEQPKIRQDVLPEEEEIIDRLEGPDLSEEVQDLSGEVQDLPGEVQDLPEEVPDISEEVPEGDL